MTTNNQNGEQKCDLLLSKDVCRDGNCVPRKIKLCCLNCTAINCEYRCDKSKEVKDG